jgi:hypothetical protein
VSITNTASQVSYTANGAGVVFAVPFRFLDEEHLLVEVKASGGTSFVTQVLDVDYTVSGEDDDAGGSVTFGPIPALNSTVRITRVTPRTQETSFRNNGQSTFSPVLHERALDKLTMIAQEEDRRLAALEALGSLLNVATAANAAFFSEDVPSAFDVEDAFPFAVAVANGANARAVVFRVYTDDGTVLDVGPNVQWAPGPGNFITILKIDGLASVTGGPFHVDGMVFF